jgi:opacity protein-like surface antigen
MFEESKKSMLVVFFIALLFLNSSQSERLAVHTLGLRTGAGLYNNEMCSEANLPTATLKTDLNATGSLFTFGMQYEADFLPSEKGMTQGISIGGDVNSNKSRSYFRNDSHNNVNVPAGFEFVSLLRKADIALRLGWLCESGAHFFVKGGGVFGQWKFRGEYLGYANDSRKNLFGFLVGAGLDVPISQSLLVGSSIEYEKYSKMKGLYTHPNATTNFTHWSVNPSVAKVSLNVKYRFARNKGSSPAKKRIVEKQQTLLQKQPPPLEPKKAFVLYKRDGHVSAIIS